MRIRTVLAILALLLASPLHAQVIFIDPCGIEMPPFLPSQLQVWVCVEGGIAAGIITADFRIAGLPAGWVTGIQPTSGNVVTGDPFAGGATVVLPGCQTGSGNYLPLFTATVLPTTSEVDVVLMVAGRTPPEDPAFACSFVRLCDTPIATRVCVGDHGSIVNPRNLGCGLSVAGLTWGQVKALYE